MPFVPPDSGERSLTEVLDFIREQDACSRADAWEQFCQMAPWSKQWLWSVVWADRQPPPLSFRGRIIAPSDVISPSADWEHAKLEDDDRISFQNSPPRPVKITLWQNFRSMWSARQPLRAEPERIKPIGRPPSRQKAFWPAAREVAFQWLTENGCPVPADGNQARLEEHVTEWLGNHGHEAGESTVRRHVAGWIKERRAELKA